MEPIQAVEVSAHLSNTYKKDLDWLHLINKLTTHEKQQVSCQQRIQEAIGIILRRDSSVPWKARW